MSIHHHAIVHPNASLGAGVSVGPFCYIEDDVEIDEGSYVHNGVTIFSGSRIGKNVQIFPGAVIGGVPQDLKFRGEYTTAEVGDNTVIREHVTVNRGTVAAGRTVVGKNCLLMAYAHVAHDCILGDNIIIANNVNLAGHVILEDYVIIEGQVGVQQFVRIGRHSFIAGGSLVRKSVPPYIRAAREPLSYIGVNRIGLQRRGFSIETINAIHEIYRILFVKGLNISNAITEIEASVPVSDERDEVIRFINTSDRTGIIRAFQAMESSVG